MSVHQRELTTSARGVSFGKRGLSRLVVIKAKKGHFSAFSLKR